LSHEKISDFGDISNVVLVDEQVRAVLAGETEKIRVPILHDAAVLVARDQVYTYQNCPVDEVSQIFGLLKSLCGGL
jgi:hypothetical protein